VASIKGSESLIVNSRPFYPIKGSESLIVASRSFYLIKGSLIVASDQGVRVLDRGLEVLRLSVSASAHGRIHAAVRLAAAPCVRTLSVTAVRHSYHPSTKGLCQSSPEGFAADR